MQTKGVTNAEIRQHHGRPTVFINGAPHALPGFNPKSLKGPFEASMPFFYEHRMGVYIIQPAIAHFWTGDEVGCTPLAEEGTEVFSLDEQAEHVLNGDPEAYLMVRFTPYPPPSWKALHPQEYFLTEQATTPGSPSLASDLFWETMAKVSAAVVRYTESRPWAERVIGYTNFHVTEGTHSPVDQGWLFDHNPAMVQRWRDFLKKKYGTVESLQEAYGAPRLAFETADVPRDRLRGSVPEVSGILYWQAGRDNRPLRDYLELQRDLWHQRFRQVCAAMHEAVERKVIFLHDALKQTMLGWNLSGFFGEGVSWSYAYPEVMAGSGHIGVAALFDAPGCDGLMTPFDYQARGIGGVCEAEGIADSLILRGKYYFGEMDQRTYPVGAHEFGTPRDYGEFAALTWRNFAIGWTRGFNSYLFDIGGGYYDTEAFHEIIGRQVEVVKESLHWPHETVPGIAMILDDSSVLETNGSGNYLNEAVMWEQKMGLARCGVPFRIYLFEDLALKDFPNHRVFYFPNLFRVDDERLALLKEKVFGDGKVVVWGPGSGISDGEQIGTASAARLTGFEFEMLPVNSQRRVLITNYEHPITYGLEADTIIGGSLSYGPVLFPKDGAELGMAWTKWQCNQMGLALKEFGRGASGGYRGREPLGKGDYAAIFSTAVPLAANLWRNIARYAGAHVYCEANEVVMADSSVVALHSVKSGPKRLALPGRFRVYDLISGNEYARDILEITFDLRTPETRVFLLEK